MEKLEPLMISSKQQQQQVKENVNLEFESELLKAEVESELLKAEVESDLLKAEVESELLQAEVESDVNSKKINKVKKTKKTKILTGEESLLLKKLKKTKKARVNTKLLCDQCDYTGFRRSLTKHKKAKHDGVRYPCDQCELSVSHLSDLKRHKDAKHKGKLDIPVINVSLLLHSRDI